MFNFNPFVSGGGAAFGRIRLPSTPTSPEEPPAPFSLYEFTPLRTVYVTSAAELQAAMSTALPGDDIVVADGTYVAPGDQNEVWHGEWTFGMQGGHFREGTAANPIRLRSENLWGARLARGGSTGSVLGTGGASYIIFDGLTVDESDTASLNNDSGDIVLGNRNMRSGNCIIANCRVIGRPVGYGEYPFDSHDNHFGIRLERVDDCLVINNYVTSINGFIPSPGSDWQQNNAGIALYHCTGVTIRNNDVELCGSGIYVKGNNRGISVLLNDISRCEKEIKFSFANNDEYDDDSDTNQAEAYPGAASTPILVYKNILNNGAVSGTRSKVNSNNVDFAEVTHNVYVFNNTLIDANYPVMSNNDRSSGCRFFNNIVVNGADDGGGAQLEQWNGAVTDTFSVIDRNVYYGGLDRFRMEPGGSILTLADWSTQTGFNTNATQDDPQLDASFMPQAAYAATFGRDMLNTFGGGVDSVIPVGAFTAAGETIGRITA